MTPASRARALTALALALAATAAPATGPATPRFERIGPERGLPHGTVYAILQDRDGFLWFATPDGLARWDGSSFRRFRFSGAEVALGASNRFQALHEDRERRLWAVTAAGVYRLDRSAGRFVEVPSPSAGEAHRRGALAVDGEGVLWLARGSGVERYDEAAGVFRRFDLPADAGWVAALARAPDGVVWALVTEPDWSVPRLYALSRARGPERRVDPFPASTRLFHLAFDRAGRLWLRGVARGAREAEGLRLPELPGAPDEPLQAFLEDSGGRLWLGTSSGLFVAGAGEAGFHGAPLAAERNDWQGEHVTALAEDDAGILWVGTLAGVYFADPHRKPFRHLGRARGDDSTLPALAVSAVAPRGDGAAWVGTYGGGLARVDVARGKVVERRQSDPAVEGSLCDDLVWSLLLDPGGALWVGTESGLCVLDASSDRFRRVELPLPPPRRPELHRVKDLAWAGGAVWVGTNFGLARVGAAGEPARLWGAAPSPEGLSFAEVGTLHADPDGRALFVGTTGGGLDRLDLVTGRFEHLSIGGRASSRHGGFAVYDLEPSAAGGLWIGTSDGLGRWDAGTRRAELAAHAADLPGSAVFSVAEEASGAVWLGTNQGLVRFEPAAGEVRAFDLADGIGSVEYNRHAAARLADGTLLFGGMGGLTYFDPQRIVPGTYRPPTALVRVAVLGEKGERTVEPWGLPELVLRPEDRAVTFDWAVLFFSRPDRCTSRYRLEGLDDGWIDAGTGRSARYTNLEPGRYRFRVVSANADGAWSEDGASLALRVLPPYWRTAWFRAISLLLVALLTLLGYRLRVARLRRLERMRLRIAGDLHDELGGDLSGIAVAAGVVARREALSREDRERLGGIERTAIEVMHGLRDIVWCVDPARDRVEDLAARLAGCARTLFAESGVELEFALDEIPGALSMDRRRALYLSGKELLHNAARHARARRVRLALSRTEGGLRLEVEDDGEGLAPSGTAQGTGLGSVRRRMREVGGRFELESRSGAGTRARLDVPLP